MSGISRITGVGGSTPTSPIQSNPNTSSNLANFPITFRETFVFPQKKLTIKEEYNAAVVPQESPFYKILLKLFLEILECRIDIIPTQPADAGGYVTEAFFRPQEGLGGRCTMHLPLPIKAIGKKPIRSPSGDKLTPVFIKTIEELVAKTVQNFTSEQLLRLIIVASHEFGHYQSFVRGNHDLNLKKGLYLYQRKYLNATKADEFTWLVFREECLAWQYAEAFLKKTDFSLWAAYEEVKNSSLKTYFDTLNLTNASLDTYYKMSFLGEAFKKNSSSQFFTKDGMLKKIPNSKQQVSGFGG